LSIKYIYFVDSTNLIHFPITERLRKELSRKWKKIKIPRHTSTNLLRHVMKETVSAIMIGPLKMVAIAKSTDFLILLGKRVEN
jgi:hypothetical protein